MPSWAHLRQYTSMQQVNVFLKFSIILGIMQKLMSLFYIGKKVKNSLMSLTCVTTLICISNRDIQSFSYPVSVFKNNKYQVLINSK